jgi:hypothetical protein
VAVEARPAAKTRQASCKDLKIIILRADVNVRDRRREFRHSAPAASCGDGILPYANVSCGIAKSHCQ